MKSNFNYLSNFKVDRLNNLWHVVRLGLIVLIVFLCDSVNGQNRGHSRSNWQPHDFGDTPSPTEMMARLKFHKHQETPLFDLLREAGVDIFSKLSDDDKKLAGRFVEDMILKEGINSDRVSSLMQKMNVSPEARQAFQEEIERAGGGESGIISPERRKELADNIRKQFLESSASGQDSFQWPDLQNRQQASNYRGSNSGLNGGSRAEQREEIRSTRIADNGSTDDNGESGLDTRRQARQASDASNQNSQALNQSNQTPLNHSAQRNGNNQNNRNRKSSDRLNQADRELANAEHSANSRNRQPEIDRKTNANADSRSQDRGSFSEVNPPLDSLQSQVASKMLNQLGSQLEDSQRNVLAEFEKKIQDGEISSEQIEDLLQDLQEPTTSEEFTSQLDQAGQNFGLPPESRRKLQEAYNDLSKDQLSSLQQTIQKLDSDLLTRMIAGNSNGPGGSESFSNPSNTTQPNSSPSSELSNNNLNEAAIEQLGKDFLKDALKTYNNADSGYELPPAFKQLKDRAEGKFSDREMANLGNISKQLLDGSSNIFDTDSAANNARSDGVKPGQRLDQLLASAADKVLADKKRTDSESKSLFSDTLNNALGVALDQAVTAAEMKEANRGQSGPAGREQSSKALFNDNNIQDRLSSFRDSNNTPFDTASNSNSSGSSNSTSSNNDSSIDNAAAAIADSVSQIKFTLRPILYAAGLLALLVVTVYLLKRFLASTDENKLKQRELQRKLQISSSNPKDVVEAVDLFLLTQYGDASSWWNAKHAADQITNRKPDWREQVASLFQVYLWSRYQADGDASVSSEQNELVKSTLRELSQRPINGTIITTTPESNSDQPPVADDEAAS